MAAGGTWDDLSARLASSVAMGVAGVVLIALGGLWFAGLAAVVSGIMIWELGRMMGPGTGRLPVGLGVLTGGTVLAAFALPGIYALPLLAAPALVGAGRMPRDRVIYAVYALAIALAGYALARFRVDQGMAWMVWLVLVVIATDVAGYFAGRFIGGPKFWPRVSPKKTWSGTLAGWVSAGLAGAVFAALTGAGAGLALVSVVLSFASQMGDVAESAIKRRTGVKDSSSLLPGHGGLADRFDGLLGAALCLLLASVFFQLPEVRF
ncbi:phosphatidate cytidylyltransferase [Rhodovulum euryhalinum]|uniref:Phosphatidate cytidylyltransferase n=1 Tax=Rhodovulum euryhalinum TaxID=35805 RepID=A0A4R2KIF2_9RHOB|nr:phosphatidate cytidylyltransferase [Rhodovulum euryhalinum]TCO69778.1 phosphatidate cytidylyltransferase [Rhodovulum euryhalinum]